ncbi:MAG: ATP-binding protein [Chlamydiia bacterium]|nr:ATP-binding protein [Chlamydiia bacterium]
MAPHPLSLFPPLFPPAQSCQNLRPPKQIISPFHNQIGLIKQVKGHFKKYLERGYYPFTFENEEVYYERLIRVIDKTIFEDIANFYQLKTPHLHTFKKLLSYLSSVPPRELNTNNLAKNIGLSNQTTFHYLTILNDVGLARFVFPYETGNQLLRKPQKMFLHNTNLLYALQHYLGQNPSQGTVRELFFLQALNDANHQTFYLKIGDYRTTNTLFEIGGKNKTDKQLKGSDLPAYLVKDDILMPTVGTLPLLYFGFLY